MLAAILVFVFALYLIGLRADRVNAVRTHERVLTEELGPTAMRHSDRGAVSGASFSVSTDWHARFLHMRHLAYVRGKRVKKLKRALMHRADVVEAINLACTAYKTSCSRVYWIAHCESTLNPNAKNASEASGLGQFIDSTWRSTPYARFSVFSPLANALAIAYEVSLGNSTVHWYASKSCWSQHS